MIAPLSMCVGGRAEVFELLEFDVTRTDAKLAAEVSPATASRVSEIEKRMERQGALSSSCQGRQGSGGSALRGITAPKELPESFCLA